MTAKETVRERLARLPDDCTLEDVLHHLYVLQAVARGEADEAAGRTTPHQQVDEELRRKWLLGRARRFWAASAMSALDQVIASISVKHERHGHIY
jgi:predicted transcriptional regulator